MTRLRDRQGNVTLSEYDAAGNLTVRRLSHGAALCGAESAADKHGLVQSGLGMVESEANSSQWSRRTTLRRPDPEARSVDVKNGTGSERLCQITGTVLLGEVPVPFFTWTRHVNGVETEAELKALRHSLARGTPFVDTHWQTKTAAMLGLESSLRPRSRPKQQEKYNVPLYDFPFCDSWQLTTVLVKSLEDCSLLAADDIDANFDGAGRIAIDI